MARIKTKCRAIALLVNNDKNQSTNFTPLARKWSRAICATVTHVYESSVGYVIDCTYEPWLNYDEFQDRHPILGFVLFSKIPTIIFSPGTIYEPDASSLELLGN